MRHVRNEEMVPGLVVRVRPPPRPHWHKATVIGPAEQAGWWTVKLAYSCPAGCDQVIYVPMDDLRHHWGYWREIGRTSRYRVH